MLSPIAIIKRLVDGIMQRGFGRIINITSNAVKSPVDGLGLSTGAHHGRKRRDHQQHPAWYV